MKIRVLATSVLCAVLLINFFSEETAWLGTVTGQTSTTFVWLFTSFRGNGEDGLHLAYSRDGYRWTALKNDQSFLTPTIGTKLMRDPSLIQGPDGMFHLVWTTG